MRRPALAVALFACLVSSAGRAGEVYVGTQSHGPGWAHVYRHAGGTSWDDITPPGIDIAEVWDLEWFDGLLFASGRRHDPVLGEAGFIAWWDGSSWTTWDAPGERRFTALAVSQDGLHAVSGSFGGGFLWRWTGAGFAPLPGVLRNMGRAAADPCASDRRIHFGEDFEDNFVTYDPAGTAGGGLSCPVVAPPFEGAGCYHGSCIHSMAMHDSGAGPIPYAGAWIGAFYRWDESAGGFAEMPDLPGFAHVQALASFRGRLVAGLSDGRLHDASDPFGGYVLLGDLSPAFPVSSLAADTDADRLWIGNGGVPFSLARHDGTSMVRTWDGSSFEDRAVPGSMDDGVVSLLVVPDAIEPSDQIIDCLWPPNHRMVTFTRDDVGVEGTFACSGGAVGWRFASCLSNQPEDTTGDGHFAPDCVVAPDGESVAVRAERRGDVRGPRIYEIGVVPSGAPPGASPTTAGVVIVPHDVKGCR